MRRIYSIWCYFWFLFLFLLLFPFFFLFLQKESWHPKAHFLNRLWGKLFFPLCGIKIEIEYRFEPEQEKTYVFVSNHTSYLDIAVMGVVLKNYYAFIGKKSITRIPLFGYTFRKLHIAVDRKSQKQSYETMQIALKTLSGGRSMMVFPEGGIKTTNPPFLYSRSGLDKGEKLIFKDGAFRMAIEKQIPLVPITFPHNWLILPDDGKLLFRKHTLKVIIHDPIETIGLTINDIPDLMQKTHTIITDELKKYYPDKI